MKLTSVSLARTIWLFSLSELNPLGIDFSPVFRGCAERYGFKKFPQHMLDLDSDKAFTFEGGVFDTSAGKKIAIKMRIYTDGIISDCWSNTKDADEFLIDLSDWIRKTHGFPIPDIEKIRKIYLSQLVVTSDTDPLTMSPKVNAFVELLSDEAAKSGHKTVFTLGSIGFWSHDFDNPKSIGPFKFERKLGTTLEEKRFFTEVPLTTDVHLKLLSAFEKVFS